MLIDIGNILADSGGQSLRVANRQQQPAREWIAQGVRWREVSIVAGNIAGGLRVAQRGEAGVRSRRPEHAPSAAQYGLAVQSVGGADTRSELFVAGIATGGGIAVHAGVHHAAFSWRAE